MAQQKWHNVAQQMAQRPPNQQYASQPKNPTATRKRTGYRAMYKTDTHSDIICQFPFSVYEVLVFNILCHRY